MKRSQIILFSVFLMISGLIYVIVAGNKKEYTKEIKEEKSTVFVSVRKVQNKLTTNSIVSYGQITPNSEVIISVEVQGKLEKGELIMKPGTNFRKGQILYKVNNAEAFYSLNSRKSALSNMILNALPDVELDFPNELDKWIGFINKLDPAKPKLLPELPEFGSGKEKMFMMSRNIITEYYNLKSQESRMEKYFYAAPFNGTVIATYAEPGSVANPGGQLAKIAKTGDFEVKVPISIDDLELYKDRSSAEFVDSKGTSIATGNIIRVSDVINQQTQSADVYYSIKPKEGMKVYNGMFVNVTINEKASKKTMTLPRVAVKNGKVNILDHSVIKSVAIMKVGSKPDSIFVTGLNDGQMVLLEQLSEKDEDATYEGVIR